MARRKTEFDPSTPYHIGSRCINRDWFGQPMDYVWDLMGRHLYFATHAFHLRIHSFVLMTNHFHMIASAPNGNFSESLAYFLRESSRELVRGSGRINQTWGGRFFRSRLGSYQYYMQAYKYVYRNPVEASLCKQVETYPYSTLSGLLGQNRILIPVVEDTLIFDSELAENLRWLNTKPEPEHKEAVRKALKKSDFRFSRNKNNNRLHSLEHRLY